MQNCMHCTNIHSMIFKTHIRVLCGPRSPGHTEMGVSILTETTKQQFYALIDLLSFIRRSPNLLWKCLPIMAGYKFEGNCPSHFRDASDQNFSFFLVFFSSVFRTNHKIDSNLQAHILIWLKFGTLVGYMQANSGSNFGENTAKIHRVANIYLCMQRSNFF